MRTRNAPITLATSLLLVMSGSVHHALAAAASKGSLPEPALTKEYLEGSMQGKSGIALDLNGDENEDLVVGAPYVSGCQEARISGGVSWR